MANRKIRCKLCREYFPREQIVATKKGKFCTFDHALEWAQQEAKKPEIKQKVANHKQRERKKAVTPLKAWQDKLQALVNQGVRHRDRGLTCCTCGNSNPTEAGHYRSRGACPELRYELTNIHFQCHACNVYGSGMRAEYREFIKVKYGEAHLEWLDGPHAPLSKDWEWYEGQIKEWRQKLREAGLTPCR